MSKFNDIANSIIGEAYLSPNRAALKTSFDKENWSPLVKALDQASMAGGNSDKHIAVANIAQHLFNLLSGKEGVVEPEEKEVLERVGKEVLGLFKILN